MVSCCLRECFVTVGFGVICLVCLLWVVCLVGCGRLLFLTGVWIACCLVAVLLVPDMCFVMFIRKFFFIITLIRTSW